MLEFNINFDVAFFTAITPFGGKNKANIKNEEQNKAAGDKDKTEYTLEDGQDDNMSASGNVAVEEKIKNSTGSSGGGDLENTKTSVARDFNEALMNSTVDLITADMTIWGDPYFIADSGMGNYNAGETDLINLTADGTMDYQSSEVDIQLNFRTPLDQGKGNYMDFPNVGITPVGAFSGVYNIMTMTNSFNEGVFTQKMKMIRRRNQPGEDTRTIPTSTGNKLVTEKTKSKETNNTQGAGTTNTSNSTLSNQQQADEAMGPR